MVLAQLNYRLCDYAANTAKIIRVIDENRNADLIVFSELAVSGYHPQDLVEEPDFLVRQQQALDRIIAATRSSAQGACPYVAIGAVTRNTGVGKRLHDSLVLVRNGEVVLTYHKQLLPTYDIFDEHRHFEPGDDRAAVADINGHRVGFLVCEDGWNADERDYRANPLRTLALHGVDLIVSINASPSNVGKQRLRHDLFTRVARAYQVPIVYVNQVGANDQIVFDGASFAVDPAVGVVYELPLFSEAAAEVRYDAHGFSANGARLRTPVARYLTDPEFYYQQIKIGLHDYVRKVGFRGVVVGSSGGIDSALTIALAADTLGAANVKAVTMPSIYSSAGSVNDSKALCRNLGVELYLHEIGELFASYKAGFLRSFGAEPSKLTRENVQARIRGTILMEYSNHFGHLVLSTGNKSEMSVGYATLYGDMNGGLNLIGDLYKTEVYALAQYYNALHGRDIIPAAVIEKEPSAELSEGQRDTDSLPPYAVLDQILKLHIEGARLRADERSDAEARLAGLEAGDRQDLIARVANMVAHTEFKRRQAAPIIRCRARAFGNGRQMPLAAAY